MDQNYDEQYNIEVEVEEPSLGPPSDDTLSKIEIDSNNLLLAGDPPPPGEHPEDNEMDPKYATSPWLHPSVAYDEVGRLKRAGSRKINDQVYANGKMQVPKPYIERYDMIRQGLLQQYGYSPEDFVELPGELSSLERRFVIEYAKCHSTKHTMIAIFGKPASKSEAMYQQMVGVKLSENPLVKSCIDSASVKAMETLDINSMRVLIEVAKIAFANISDFTNWTSDSARPRSLEELEASGTDTGPVKKIVFRSNKNGDTFELELYDRMAALGMLAKIFKMVPDQVEHSGKDGQPIVTVNASDALVRKLASLAQRNAETRSALGILPAGDSSPGEGLAILG